MKLMADGHSKIVVKFEMYESKKNPGKRVYQ